MFGAGPWLSVVLIRRAPDRQRALPSVDILEFQIRIVTAQIVLEPFVEEDGSVPQPSLDGFGDRSHQVALLARQGNATRNSVGQERAFIDGIGYKRME